MLASEYIQRMQDLIEVSGIDPEVVIEHPDNEDKYQEAGVELQNCKKTKNGWKYSHTKCDTQVLKVY